MIRLELLQRTSSLLGRFAHEVKVSNLVGLFDINRIAEDFLIPILKISLKCPDLSNQNRIKMNFPAVDLGCKTSRVSIQITSDCSSNKICETLDKFRAHELANDFDHLYIYVITGKQDTYKSKKLQLAASALPIHFEPSTDILDYKDLAKIFVDLTNEQLEIINTILEDQFRQIDAKLKFRNNLVDFISICQKKIENEKRTRKYIPSVFVETSEIKEEMRFFANPMLFYKKIDAEIQEFNLTHFNSLLCKAKLAPFTDALHEISELHPPKIYSELQARLEVQNEVIKQLHDKIAPFSWDRDLAKPFSPCEDILGYWKVFKVNIEQSGSGVIRSLNEITNKIKIAKSKIFLITGMAGQGKTNFICDLFERQFKAFGIPAIFIPGRSLNDYRGPDRILSYIKNNRFAPDASSLQELFALLNDIAIENNKPFVIAIDGINEIGALDEFSSELRIFIEAVCQYDFVKMVITCRNEFFDQKFAHIFEAEISDHLHHVKDLRREMSDHNKSRLTNAYMEHFRINARFSAHAKVFLENDLILLRIFSEINEGKDIGYIADVYKGDVFDGYLTKKINEFPRPMRQKVINALYKLCAQMFREENFAQISLDWIDEQERDIIEKLIGEDIILRREVPSSGFSTLGIENISFTYDELRDFLLASYTIENLSKSDPPQVSAIFEKLSEWPINEGFFRYSYILSRKRKCELVLAACESAADFSDHFINNLSLLSADIQTTKDIERIESILRESTVESDIQEVAWFLQGRRNCSEILNINILLNHLRILNDNESESFVKAMFYSFSDYRGNTWRDRVSHQLRSLNELTKDRMLGLGESVLALILYFAPHAHWSEREAMLDFFVKHKNGQEVQKAVEICKESASSKVLGVLNEISKCEGNS